MKRSPGFTLVELAIALAIVSVGVVLAGSSLQSWIYRYNYSGFGRGIFMEAAQAKSMAAASQRQHRLFVDVSGTSVRVQRGNAATGSNVWTDVAEPITAEHGCEITSVVRTTGGVDNVVNTGTVAVVFNSSGDLFPFQQALIRFSGTGGRQGQVRIFGWTSKARLENAWTP